MRKKVVLITIILIFSILNVFVNRIMAIWSIEAIDGHTSPKTFYSMAIAVDSSCDPHIVYIGGFLYYAYHDGSIWRYEIIDLLDTVDYTSITLDSQDNVLSYYDESNGSLKYATNALFDGYLTLGPYDYLEAFDHSELDIGTESRKDFTIEAWFYETSILRSDSIIKKHGSYGVLIERRQYLYPEGYRTYSYLCFSYMESGNWIGKCYGTSPPFTIGWHHIAIVGDSGQLRFYFDGELKLESEYLAPLIDSTENLEVGKGGLGKLLDEIRISDVPRYDGEHFDPPPPFICDDNTRALWHFDEPQGAKRFHDVCGVDNILFKIYPGDFDADGDCDGSDLAVFAVDFGRTDCSGNCEGDFDNNNNVDDSDLAVFAKDFGQTSGF
ncbi:MAG: LamG-like jellyroll fold domain-containing protein [bacterium]